MTSQEDRERFAPLFGFWPCLGCGGWNNDTGICRTTSELPDFCDIKGPYFGPACEELLNANAVVNRFPFGNSFYWVWHFDDCVIGTWTVEDDSLGRCTMLALEKKREMDAKK